MGQRHQLFVIARIASRYRTLAAVHHQWLYGESALQRCLRVLDIFRARSNRIPIFQELRAARKKDDNFWARRDEFQPFPFVATCLTAGSSCDPSEGYQHRVHPLAFNITFGRVDNDDGITVIDISDPNFLRFCFTFLGDGVKPLGASTYLWRYMRHRDYLEPEQDSDDAESQGYSMDDEEANDTQNREDIETQTSTPPSLREVNCDEVGRPSLRDQTMDQLINTALEDPDFDLSSTAVAQQLSDFIPKYRRKLLSLTEKNELPSLSALDSRIELAFAGETVVDLSPFSNLPAEHLVKAASNLLQSGQVKSLDLSHLQQLSENDLTGIFGAESGLETLYLLEMPQISLRYVASMWNRPESGIKDIYHTELLRRPLVEKPTFSKFKATLQSPLVTDAKNPVKHILWARVITGKTRAPNVRKADSFKIDWHRLKPAAGLSDYYDKAAMCCASFPINDTLLPPTKLVTGLTNFLLCISRAKYGYGSDQLSDIGFTMAKSFALASPRLTEEEAATTIGPLPELMFGATSVAAKSMSFMWPLDFPQMKAGERSVVIINEHDRSCQEESEDKEKFRLAVVTHESAGYEVQSMETYLEEVMKSNEDVTQLLEYWKRNTEFVSACESKEIHELLPAMERNMKLLREGWAWEMVSVSWDR
ncbi:MAG: hypothetical protein Q9225_001367 [Loekoesia sp. 1 TL-2023]